MTLNRRGSRKVSRVDDPVKRWKRIQRGIRERDRKAKKKRR